MMNKKPFFIMLGMVLACPQFLKAMDKNKLLLDAAKTGNFGDVRKSLHEGAKVNTIDRHGYTALHFASGGGYIEIVKLLLDTPGINVHIVGGRLSNTPLHWAARYGREEVVKLLIGARANVNAVDKNADTPLHVASSYGNKKIVELLIDKGADPTKENLKGKTAADVTKTQELKDYLTSITGRLPGEPKMQPLPQNPQAAATELVRRVQRLATELNAIPNRPDRLYAVWASLISKFGITRQELVLANMFANSRMVRTSLGLDEGRLRPNVVQRMENYFRYNFDPTDLSHLKSLLQKAVPNYDLLPAPEKLAVDNILNNIPIDKVQSIRRAIE